MKSVSSISKKPNTRKRVGIKSRIGRLFFGAAAVCGVLLFTAAGCRTTRAYIPERSMAGYLPQDSPIIGKIDVENNRELFTEIAAGFLGAEEDLKSVFDRTAAVLFAAEMSGGGMLETFFIIRGDFPRGMTFSIISGNDGWEKHFSGRMPWWENKTDRMQIAVPERGIIFVAPSGIERMLERYRKSIPADFNSEVLHEMEVSDLVIFLQKPAQTLLGDFPVDLEKFPLKSLWFTMIKSMEQYDLSGAFLLGTKEEAKKMAMFSRILLVGWIRKNNMGDISKLKETLTVEPKDNYVRVSGIPLEPGAAERFIFSLFPGRGPSLE